MVSFQLEFKSTALYTMYVGPQLEFKSLYNVCIGPQLEFCPAFPTSYSVCNTPTEQYAYHTIISVLETPIKCSRATK